MTTYGTIPTSSGGANLEFIGRAKERMKAGLGTRQPWRLMFKLLPLNVPTNFTDAIVRIKTNLSYFRMNYAIIFLVILFLSLIWHPISMIVFMVMMAAWVVLYFLRDVPLVICGRTIGDRVVLIVLSGVTVLLLLFTQATAYILGALGIGVLVVVVHATFRKTDDLYFLDEEAAGSGG